jgi:hydroxymethylbilane synthase
MLPSVGQGVLGIELRKNDEMSRNAVSFLNHPQTWMEVSAERAFLKRLGGGCQLPIAAYGQKKDNDILLRGLLGSLDGKVMIKDEERGRCNDAELLGTTLAERILSRGGKAILDDVYEKGNICGETG